MAVLTAGTAAPDFTLPTAEGQVFSLAHARQKGPVVLAFLKTNCPVCRYAFPFLERLHAGYREQGLSVVAVSQNSAQDTTRFRKEYAVSFPAVLDNPADYRVSNAYGIRNTPTVFLITSAGTVFICSVGWSRTEMAAINTKLAELLSSTEAPIFRAGEEIAEWKPG
jgi:peroxiredoxin